MSRHSSFSRSSAPRPWRSVSKPAGPSVSLVFAEPEHAEPVGSAAAMLSPRRYSTEAEDVEESPPRKRERSDAATSLRKASFASLSKGSQNTAAASLGDTANLDVTGNEDTRKGTAISRTPSPQPISDGVNHVPVEPIVSSPPPLQRSPERTGWFGSLSRKPQPAVRAREETGGKAQVMSVQENGSSKEATRPDLTSEVANQPPSALDSNPPPVQAVPFPTVDTTSSFEAARKPSPPQDIPQKKSAGWFLGVGSSASTQPAPIPDPFVPSSVDDNVPILSSFATPSSSPPPAAQVRPRERTNSNLSSLNPSSSRFTLSMPLLGRSKVPLDQVVIQAERAGATGEHLQDAMSSVPPGTDHRGINIPITAKFTSLTVPAAVQDIDFTNTPRDTSSEHSSWWGYIGLGSSSSIQVDSLPTVDSPSTPANTGSVPPPPPEPVAQPAPSVTSAETRHTQTSAWYTPWRWYGGAAMPTSPPLEHDGKTQAEMVKEEALARSQPVPASSPSVLETEPSNPIIANFENQASWISFFASRSAASVNVKAVKEKGEVMEIMNIDSDEEEALLQPSGLGGATHKKAPPSPLKPGTPKPEQEPAKRSPNAPPLTRDDAVRHQASQRPSSPSSKRSVPPASPRPPNLVLPTFEDTFGTPPRSIPLPKSASTFRRTIRYMSGILFPEEEKRGRGKGKGKEHGVEIIGRELPRTWAVLGDEAKATLGGLVDTKRVVVIGIHGWFPGSIIRQVLGEPTGTSGKFANMMAAAIEEHFAKYDVKLEKLTKIVLEGEGTIERRVNNLYQEYLNHEDWIDDLHNADAIFVATHSQGSIVSTQFLDRLITEGHIRTEKSLDIESSLSVGGGEVPVPISVTHPQRVCCLAMCGIHLGPLVYLNTSSLVNPYLQYFESAAARELFEFQDSESQVSKTYVKALSNVLAHGAKFTYIASMNDQVVPIYSGSFTTAAHPLILRALYIDGDAYSSSDFLSNLLVLLLRIRSCGLEDGGLITHLSEATAGSLSGVGHSSAYEEPATYALAVRFLFETSGALGVHPDLEVQQFTARAARNDYEIPWALRDLIANPDVAALFTSEISELRAAFDDWHPKTTILRDLRRKLEPIRRLPTSRL